MSDKLVIATRSSPLALWQAEWVKGKVMERFPDLTVELLHIKTKGDKILDTPLAKIGGKGLFTKELEVAILQGEADIAVHSMKDMPIELPEGLEISVITKRETPEDAFVSNKFKTFDSLPEGAVVGTSSLRRVAQLQNKRRDLSFQSLRGNVNTRLRKLDEGVYDAIILASAGLIRLGMENRITEHLDHQTSLPAIAQGVVCIESRINDERVLSLINFLKHGTTDLAVRAERALLHRLNGGCQVPLAGHAVLDGSRINMSGLVASPDGMKMIRLEEDGSTEDPESIGIRLGERLLNQGGREILASVGIETH